MALREEKEFAIRAKQKNSVREEANVVSDTSHDREKPTPKTAPSSEQPTPRGRSASRKKEPQEAGVRLGSSNDSRAETS